MLSLQCGRPISVGPEVYPVQIAFNVIPHGGDFDTNGYTSEEMKLVHETRKILGDATIGVNATVVRVPVFYGHSDAVNVETRDKLTAARARERLQDATGVERWEERRAGQEGVETRRTRGQQEPSKH